MEEQSAALKAQGRPDPVAAAVAEQVKAMQAEKVPPIYVYLYIYIILANRTFCASSAFGASRPSFCCIAGLITRPDYQFTVWDLHWSGFLVGSLVVVVCAVLIYLAGLSSSGCRRSRPARLTSFFGSWS